MSFVPPHPPPMPVSFAGHGGEFSGLVTRGAGLDLVTVVFYRFWLATDIRRHLWSNTHIDGDSAEYTGRGRELLIGFLIALAILVPIYLAYFLVGLDAERYRAFPIIPFLLFFYLCGQFAMLRGRRYRRTRTVWGGVRFWMRGSGWAYAGQAALWGVLMILHLGLILPWREAALERYKMRHSYYGDLQGSFEGRGWEFFKRGWWLWPLAPIALYVTPLAPFVYAAFKAVEWRWWLSGIRFGDVRLESAMRRRALIGLYWKVIAWLLLLAVAFAAYLGLCAALVASMSGAPLDQFFTPQVFLKSIPLLVLAGRGFLLFALALKLARRVYLVCGLWGRGVASAPPPAHHAR